MMRDVNDENANKQKAQKPNLKNFVDLIKE